MRPRRLWIALALQAIIVRTLGAGAAMFAIAGVAAFGPFGAILLFAATLLGGLAFVAFGGLVGTWHGTRRGFWWALGSHAFVALGVAALMLDGASPGRGAEEHLPGAVGLALLGGSALVLLTPTSRDWFGV